MPPDEAMAGMVDRDTGMPVERVHANRSNAHAASAARNAAAVGNAHLQAIGNHDAGSGEPAIYTNLCTDRDARAAANLVHRSTQIPPGWLLSILGRLGS